MLTLNKGYRALMAGDNPKPALRDELRALPDDVLPLQQSLRHGSIALKDELEPLIYACRRTGDDFELDCELFYHSIVAGCQCADDPSPEERLTESVRLLISLRAPDGTAQIRLENERTH